MKRLITGIGLGVLLLLAALFATAQLQSSGRADGDTTPVPAATATKPAPATKATPPAAAPTKPVTTTAVVTPTITVTRTTTITPTTTQAGLQPVCKLDKISTANEVNSAGPQRQEIGGASGVQHVDFYPTQGTKSVSYILPKGGAVKVWSGFGSIWQGDGPECSTFNWVADAMQYARARAGNGHSGLVVDLRSGSAVIVANTGNLNQSQINDLLTLHRNAQGGTVSIPTTAPGVTIVGLSALAVSVATGPVTGCPPAKETTFGLDDMGTDVTVRGPAIVHPWWNNGKSPFDQTQVRTKVFPGTEVTFLQMLGKTWTYEDNSACGTNLEFEFENAKALPVRGLDQLKADGLVR